MDKRIYLNDDWFFNSDFRDEMLEPDFSFENNEKIRLPHTVKETPLHYFDESEYQMISAYMKVLNIPKDWEDKDILLTFEGVLHSCVVYVNGKAVGSHECGYTAFRVRLNDAVRFGEDNKIVVKADSRESQNIPPFGFVIDYMTYGGIYRDVYLDIKEKAHIEDVFVSADMDGNVRLEVKATDAAKGALLESSIVSLNKKEDGSYTEGEEREFAKAEYYPEDEKNSVIFEGKYEKPLCWSPDSPVLYLSKTVLKDIAGKVLDEFEVRFGFRTAEFKADGFYLNNKKLKIRGLNRHQSNA